MIALYIIGSVVVFNGVLLFILMRRNVKDVRSRDIQEEREHWDG